MTRSRTLIRSATLLTAAALAVASCGGGSSDSTGDTTAGDTTPGSEPAVTEPLATDPPATDPPATDPPATDPPPTDPPATDPPTTDAPPTTDFVLGADTSLMEFGGGFLKMDVWPGWEIVNSSDAPQPVFDDVDAAPWTWDPDESETVVELSSGDAVFALIRERRFGSVESFGTFKSGMIDTFSEIERFKIDLPVTWAGIDGYSTSFSFGSVRTGQIDDQFVSLLTFGIDTDEMSAQVAAMIDNMQFDTSLIGPLDHATDMEFFTTAAGPEFAASVLVPSTWEQAEGGESLEFKNPLTGSHASVTITPSQGGTDAMVGVITSTDLLTGEPVRVDGSVNDLDYAVLWQGEPGDANKAIIVADDGTYGVAILVETAVQILGDDPAGGRLIEQIVGSVFFGPHS